MNLKMIETITKLEKKYKVIFTNNDIKVLLVFLCSLNGYEYKHIGNAYIGKITGLPVNAVSISINNFISLGIIKYDLDDTMIKMLYKLNIDKL
ncbi:hypothetical protein [Romboutsia ilealis]|uniref:hypothetical protein n=1 Tax=Romboutsia ilealis TaxID=1115758 RepID=UPI00272C8B07|nr:hypothetical protein [Romboutsia ilealis]